MEPDLSQGNPTVKTQLPIHIETPQLAREWLRGQVRLDPLRGGEAGLLLSELLTGVVSHHRGEDADPLTVTINEGPTSVVVSLEHPQGERLVPTGFSRRIIDGIARRWGLDKDSEPPRVWFEVRTPGSLQSLADLPTDPLLERVADDADSRAEVLRRYAPLARGIARQFAGKGIPSEDLEQVAMMAMLGALERYDIGIGPFPPFARRTISGALKRHLRDHGWSVRLPRYLQEQTATVTRASQELCQQLGRIPTAAEIADHVDLPLAEVEEALGARQAYASASLDSPNGEEEWRSAKCLAIEDPALDRAIHGLELGAALDGLPERERAIVYLKYFEDLTQSEIGERLGISQMHVSRLLRRALRRLRDGHPVGTHDMENADPSWT